MLLDAHNLFSDAQSITTGSDSGNGVLSENTIDLGLAGRNIGVGEDLYVVVVCDLAMTSSGSNDTLDVRLVTAAYAALNSPTTLQTIGTFPAVSAAGTKISAKIAPATFLQYIGLLYITNGDALTQGKFTAFLTHDIDAYTSYADNITIS
jgi:hypothetical protein